MRCSKLRYLPVVGLMAFGSLCGTVHLPVYASSVPQFVLGDDDARSAVKKGIKLTRQGDLIGAEAVLRKAAEKFPDDPAIKTELAFNLIKQQRVREGYELVFPVVKADNKNAHAFAVLGTAFLAAGRFDDARLLFRNAVVIDRKDDLAWAGLGMIDFYENHIPQALANLNEAAYRGPEEPDYRFWLAQVAARAELYQEAANDYKSFLLMAGRLDKDRRERIQGLIEFLEALGRSSSLYILSGADKTKVPFELVGERPVISLRVNNHKEDLRFVLDTGSGISVISADTAKRLGIHAIARGGSARGIGGDGTFKIVYGLVNQVEIGGTVLKNVPVYIRPFQKGAESDGYIGLSLISKFLTTIDYGDRSFSLTRKDTDRQEFASATNEMSLPLRLTTGGFLSGEVTVEGVDTPLNFIVDTGASISVISSEITKTGSLDPYVHDQKMQVVGSAGVQNDVPCFKLPSVTFGPNKRKDVLAVALDMDVINQTSGFAQAGILGGNFLKNYRLTFDFRNAKVIFVPIAPEKE